MAAYVPVPRDLTRVKSKILFNLTKRQLICFGIGALIGLPVFFSDEKIWEYKCSSYMYDDCYATHVLFSNVRKRWTATRGHCSSFY